MEENSVGSPSKDCVMSKDFDTYSLLQLMKVTTKSKPSTTPDLMDLMLSQDFPGGSDGNLPAMQETEV